MRISRLFKSLLLGAALLFSASVFAQTARENFTTENANEVVATYDAGDGKTFRAVFKFTGELRGKNQWVATWNYNGVNHVSKYVELSHDAWSIYLVSADRGAAGDTAQIDFYQKQVIEKTSDGNYSGRIISFKTN